MNVAFLTRLSHIAAESAPDTARATGAIALVDAYRHSLEARLGIDASCRPTTRAKEQAKDAFDDLRLKILRAELGAPVGAARIYRVARQRIEMARRALDLRLVGDEVLTGADIPGFDSDDAARSDRAVTSAMRHRLRDRRAIATSWEAIRQSRDLLARCGVASLR